MGPSHHDECEFVSGNLMINFLRMNTSKCVNGHIANPLNKSKCAPNIISFQTVELHIWHEHEFAKMVFKIENRSNHFRCE